MIEYDKFRLKTSVSKDVLMQRLSKHYLIAAYNVYKRKKTLMPVGLLTREEEVMGLIESLLDIDLNEMKRVRKELEDLLREPNPIWGLPTKND